MRTCNSCGNSEPEDARFCGSCGAALEAATAGTGESPEVQQAVHADLATADTSTLVLEADPLPESPEPSFDPTAELAAMSDSTQSPGDGSGQRVHGASARTRSRVRLIAPAVALLVAAAAVLAIVLLNNSGSPHKSNQAKTSQTSSYRQKLGRQLEAVMSANRALSSALGALDGSNKTITAAQNATSQAQSAVSAAQGAVGALATPSSDTVLSQQAQQALTEENGYLQALASTLSTPAGNSASQLRPLITATQSAMVPLDQVAPGATSGLGGIDNVLSWAAGATASAQAARQKAQQASQQQTSTATASPGSPSGMRACDQNISVNASTSCTFADNVFSQYAEAAQQAGAPGSYSVVAYSPETGQDYTDGCNYNPQSQIVLCSHGSDLIQFPYWAAEVYQTG
jgi:hypothetical protein